jgi:cholesterol transport system auxiliary component
MNRFSKRVLLGAGVVLMWGAISGCSGLLDREPPDMTRYLLDAPRAQNADEDPGVRPDAPALEVPDFHVAAPYASNGFAYHWGGGEVSNDFYHEFVVPPGAILAHVARAWLGRSGLFARVSARGGRASPEWVLEGDILALYGDYSQTAASAVLRVQVTLLGSARREILFHREYELREWIADQEPSSLVTGWNAALRSFLTKLESDLRALDTGDEESSH